jgi:Uma2 family endonuclease
LPKNWRRNEACPAMPELLIEIISPAQTMHEFEEKAKDYLGVGVPRVWVRDPEVILIRSFLTDGYSQIYTDNMLIVDELLSRLKLTTRLIFEEAELID